MPESRKDNVCDASYRVRLSWDINILRDTYAVPPMGIIPLQGEWNARVYGQPTPKHIRVQHGLREQAVALADDISIAVALLWLAPDGTQERVQTSRWKAGVFPDDQDDAFRAISSGWVINVRPDYVEQAAKKSDGKYVPAVHRLYRLIVTIEQGVADLATEAVQEHGEVLAQRIQGLHSEQLPHNIRLFFPHVHKGGAELWARSDFLSRCSPYFEVLLASSFAENQPRRAKRARTSGITEVEEVLPAQTDEEGPDSDDETDAFLFSKKPPRLEQSSEADEVTYRQSLSDKPGLPTPVSPRSVHRLAHLLQLDDLQNRALDALSGDLDVSIAAKELFSPTSFTYDDWRQVVLDFVKANWTEVQRSKAWKDKMGDLKRGRGTAAMAALMAEVLEAVTGP
ncbi:hypothetical protein JCM11251_002639 [Rhodosporidiobolus azoricus]